MPFISLEMGTDPDATLPIRQVVLGPTVDAETAIKSLELLLASNRYSDVDIRVSSVPLRA